MIGNSIIQVSTVLAFAWQALGAVGAVHLPACNKPDVGTGLAARTVSAGLVPVETRDALAAKTGTAKGARAAGRLLGVRLHTVWTLEAQVVVRVAIRATRAHH